MRIRADRLLLVEGRDEVNLFKALLSHCFADNPGIQVIDAGGKDKFSRNLRAIQTAALTGSPLRTVGVVRDADDNAAVAFESVCDSIRSAGYEPPPNHGEFSKGVPAVGVFIVPDGATSGAIETLCRRSRQADETTACVDEYLKCLQARAVMRSRNADKTFTHAYLAATRDPVARVGEGAMQGVWDFASPVFAPLSQFLRELAKHSSESPPS